MAAHAHTPGAPTRATTFIALLLAPLPADVPQADDRGFLRQLKVDACSAWRHALRPYHVAKARLEYVRAQRLMDPSVNENAAFAAYVAEVDVMMATPTIAKEGLAWKRRHLPVGACATTLELRRGMIALDVARMEGR